MRSSKSPKFNYYHDVSDPDIVSLGCSDGSIVAAFSARGVTKEEIVEAAKEDYRHLIQANLPILRQPSEDNRSA